MLSWVPALERHSVICDCLSRGVQTMRRHNHGLVSLLDDRFVVTLRLASWGQNFQLQRCEGGS